MNPKPRKGNQTGTEQALFDAVVSYGLEGIIAKRRAGLYRSGYRGWTKVKNPSYWRRESEVEQVRRRRERVGAQTR